MQFHQNYSLKKYNTFGIDVLAKYFTSFSSKDELENLLYNSLEIQTENQRLILGGGSNILFTKNYDGLVLKNEIKGINIISEDEEHIYIKAGAGENWHQFVLYCIQNNFAGAENLSLIPGNVGASPMQNIGAYGVEIKDIFYSLEAFHLSERTVYTFTLNDCAFGYRESIFKTKFKNEFAILNVTYRLNKNPEYKISYGAIKEELEKMQVAELNIQNISTAIINIRSNKLPNPNVVGNAGSFFKNPEVSPQKLNKIISVNSGIVSYPLQNGNVKLAAGWLIEQCGWKGFRKGDVGCSARQALVLVNYGMATGKEIYDLSEEIKQSVKEKFDVQLEREVNII